MEQELAVSDLVSHLLKSLLLAFALNLEDPNALDIVVDAARRIRSVEAVRPD